MLAVLSMSRSSAWWNSLTMNLSQSSQPISSFGEHDGSAQTSFMLVSVCINLKKGGSYHGAALFRSGAPLKAAQTGTRVAA